MKTEALQDLSRDYGGSDPQGDSLLSSPQPPGEPRAEVLCENISLGERWLNTNSDIDVAVLPSVEVAVALQTLRTQ